jgi:hypothetical protein
LEFHIHIDMPPISRFKRFDARPVLARGADPLAQILRRVNALKAENGLMVIAPFLPSPLIELLAAAGCESKVQKGQGSEWIIYFWRAAQKKEPG